MLDEARAAPQAVADLLRAEEETYRALGASLHAKPPAGIVTVARGSSDHAAGYLAYLMAACSGRLVTSLPMSLVTLYHAPLATQGLLAIAISQSGRSPDLVEPICSFRQSGATTVALVNDPSSPLARTAEWFFPLHAGPERSVAATKSFVCSLVAGARLTASWTRNPELIRTLETLPQVLEQAAELDWTSAVEVLAPAERLMVIARGIGLSVAQEAALKLKETCGIQAEAFSAAEMKHGPMALVGDGYPLLVLAMRGPTQPELLQIAAEMRARGARVVLAAPADVAERDLTLTTTGSELLDPVAAIQSFYPMVDTLSRSRGWDPDRPPHLQKVTATW